MKFKGKKQGFTLIELVIVIAIIAILAAIAIPRYQRSKDKAKEVAIKSNVSMLTSAAVLKQSDMGEDSSEVKWPGADEKEYVEQWPEKVGESGYVVTIKPNQIVIELDKETLYDSSNDEGINEEKIKEIVNPQKTKVN